MKAILYARCSTTKSKQDIELQTELLEEFCKRYKWDYEIRSEFVSGKDLQKRPILSGILDVDVFQKTFDVLVVTKIDRLARNLFDFVRIVRKLDDTGIRFIAIQQGIDTDPRNPGNRLLMNMLAAFAEFEREIINERVREGLAKRKKEGKSVGAERIDFDVVKAHNLIANERMSLRKAAKAMGVNVMTLSRRIKEYTNVQDK